MRKRLPLPSLTAGLFLLFFDEDFATLPPVRSSRLLWDAEHLDQADRRIAHD